jgi:hypothetical protein
MTEGVATTVRWVGIDEAGYGPNLGPLVMTAVYAEATDPETCGAKRDFWRDLNHAVDRAGGDSARLWIDDSKLILRGGKGRERLDLACLAAVSTAAAMVPETLDALLGGVGITGLDDTEIPRWRDPRSPVDWPPLALLAELRSLVERRPLEPRCGSWRLCAIRSVIVGPARFNDDLERMGLKSAVHFAAFARLLEPIWCQAADGRLTMVRGDKHGGRHYYLGPLAEALPDAWIDRGLEGPELSRYTLRSGSRRVELSLTPRADAEDMLVALASIVSKSLRELWMDAFNAYWRIRVEAIRPTAGYPNDAERFRQEIEEIAAYEGLSPRVWWRSK